jgi:hypothetical protein
MTRSKHDEDNPINLLKRIKVLENRQEELEHLIHVIIEAKDLILNVGLNVKLWDIINRLRKKYKD